MLYMTSAHDITIRLARADEAVAVTELSELDSARRPADPVLVAEVDGALWAAVSLADRHAVADPFRPSGELVGLLRERAHQLRRRPAPRVRVAGRSPRVRFSAR